MEKVNPKVTLDAFFKKEYKKLVNYVRKNMETRYYEASPEDIVQDVALSLLGALNLDTSIESIAAYMYRSVKNKIIDSQRKKQINVSIEDYTDKQNGKSLLTITDDTVTEEPFTASVEPETLHAAIALLNSDERALIIATGFEGKTFEELSVKWNIPVGTLLSRKHRALAKLSKIITNINSIK
jgi:RNA polymerase sigma-70 factor (ECF subfamily)